MRVVSVGEESVCRLYRSLAPIAALERRGHQAVMLPAAAPVGAELASADVILGYRMMFDEAPAVREAIARGAAFVWDVDDDLANIPRESDTLKGVTAQDVARHVRQMTQLAKMADVVTTTTPQLAARYRRSGVERIEIVANYLLDVPAAFRPRPPDREPLVIGWVAAHEHRSELKRLAIARALRKILLRHAHVRVESAGIRLPLPADRYRHYTWVHISRLPALLATWDIGIAPLADITYNRARSDVKLKEYGAAGLAWLASPVGPYRELGEAQGGRLVPDYGWFDALDELVTDHATRGALAARAHAWTQTQSVDAVGERWERICHEAIERRRARVA